MKIYLATVRVLNWLVVVTISVCAILWWSGTLTIPQRFAGPDLADEAAGAAPAAPAQPAISTAQPAPPANGAPPTAPPPAQPGAITVTPGQTQQGAVTLTITATPQPPPAPAAAAPGQPQPAAPSTPPQLAAVPAVSQPAAAVQPPPAQQTPPHAGLTVENAKRTALIVGILMLALNVAATIVRLRGSAHPRYLVFEKEGSGSLKIAVDAIEDTLMKCAAEIPEIQYADIRMVLEKGGKMPRRAIAHCIFTDVPNLFVVQDNVRQILTARYQEIFPNETLVFEIVVDRLKSEHEPQSRTKKTEDETRFRGEEYFGPKYPVER